MITQVLFHDDTCIILRHMKMFYGSMTALQDQRFGVFAWFTEAQWSCVSLPGFLRLLHDAAWCSLVFLIIAKEKIQILMYIIHVHCLLVLNFCTSIKRYIYFVYAHLLWTVKCKNIYCAKEMEMLLAHYYSSLILTVFASLISKLTNNCRFSPWYIIFWISSANLTWW